MNILPAEAAPLTAALVPGTLVSCGHRVDVVTALAAAWAAPSRPAALRMASVAGALEGSETHDLLTSPRTLNALSRTWGLKPQGPGSAQIDASDGDVLPMAFELSALRSRRRIARRALGTPEGPVSLASSFGVATTMDGTHSDELASQGTSALNEANRAGGDRVCKT